MAGYHLTNLHEDLGPLVHNTALPGASQHFEECKAITFKGKTPHPLEMNALLFQNVKKH